MKIRLSRLHRSRVAARSVVNSAEHMLDLGDDRWAKLEGGYRMPFDPRPWLALLEKGKDDKSVWKALWDELHHQGDVGEASYATVPQLVRIYRQRGIFNWNVFGVVACIALCRGQQNNPPLPSWLEEDYLRAIQELAEIGRAQFPQLKELDEVRMVLSVLALSKGARMHAKFLLNYVDNELREMESKL